MDKHLDLSLTAILDTLACLNDIIEICRNADYPEDLEDIYGVLDKYFPKWKQEKEI